MFSSSVSSQTRAERLCASLSRTFDTPKLGTRESSIHEFIGPVASERYALLPPKSDAAAKALLAVGLKRGVSEVRLLENIRRRRGLPDLPSPRFDHFVSFILETPSKAFDRCAEICDSYTPSPHLLDLIPHTPVEGKQYGTNMPLAAYQSGPDSVMELQHLQLADHSELAPNASVVDVDAIQTSPRTFGPASQHAPDTNPFQRIVSEAKPLGSTHKDSAPLEKLAVDLCFNDQTGKVSIDLVFIPVQLVPKRGPQPFARIANLSTLGQPKAVSLTDKFFPSSHGSPSELPSATNPADVENHAAIHEQQKDTCNVRPNAPALNMTTLQGEILMPPVSPPAPTTKTRSSAEAPQSDSGDDVILIETGPKPAPSPTVAAAAAAAKSRRKRPNVISRRSTPLFQRRKRVRDTIGNTSQSDPQPSNKIAPALLRNRQTAARASLRETTLRRSKRRARPIAPMVDESDTENEYRNQEIDEDFEPEVEPVARQSVTTEEPSHLNAERPPHEEPGRLNTGSTPQRAKHVRFSDEVEEMQLPELDVGSPALRTRSRHPSSVSRKPKTVNIPLQDEEEEVLDSHDNVISRRKVISRARIRKSLPQPSRSKRNSSSTFGGTRIDNRQDPGTKENGPSLPNSPHDNISGERRNLWKEDVMKLEVQLREDDMDSLTSDQGSDTPLYVHMPLLQLAVTRLSEKSISIEDLDSINPEEETLRYYKDAKNDPPYAPDSESSGLKWVEDCVKQMLGSQPWVSQSSENDDIDPHQSDVDEDEDDIDKGIGRKIYRESSDSSDLLETSDDEEGNGRSLRAVVHGGSKRSRREARSRASKARELQGRVCGDLLATMTSEARRRVLRWAERDFTWFDSGCDFMEIVAARSSKRCNRCNMPDDDDLMCEESILLKLWKDMSWRKVRRMRHRHNER